MTKICRFILLFLACELWLSFTIGCSAGVPSISSTQPATVQVSRPTKAFETGLVEIIPSPAFTLTPQLGATPGDDLTWALLEQIDPDRVFIDLRRITGEEPVCLGDECYTIANRLTGSDGLRWAKQYIRDELVKFGYAVEVQDWARSGYADQNLIVRKQGDSFPEEEIYFVAHLDGMKKGEEERYPAADDNASGVVDILELGRILSSYELDRTLVLFFSTGEEQGSLGVKSYLDQLTQRELRSIKYVINVDVIGYDANQDGVMQLFHGNHYPSRVLTQTMEEIILDYATGLSPVMIKGCP